ncbi:hypothetical protein [Poseidonocella sp. HB161398]|uniref:hypothetical protein n=1 Tax=Poseidonocella sp. HB161398 TaxID=2320855 RepID=UPI001107DEF7|nr:hypothetical protein [Poseidonocella sp. HB161398]
MRFSEIVRQRLAELGLNVNQAETLYGFRTGYLRSAVRQDAKEASPTLERAQAICAALGLELYVGPPRVEAPPSVEQGELLVLPMPEVAGPGPASLGLPPDWLEARGVSEPLLLRAGDAAMSPLVPMDAAVLADGADRSPCAAAAIFALRRNDRVLVRRLSAGEDWLLLRPDNPAIEAEVLPRAAMGAGVTVLGRVRAVFAPLLD